MVEKYNLKDVTFLIQVQLDSIDRLVNLKMVINFLQENFDTNIQILEAGHFNNGLIQQFIPRNISYRFIEDYDPVYYRTLYINKMVDNCKTPFLSVWETDIVVPPEQVIAAVEMLRNNSADFTSPYEKKALDTSFLIRQLFYENQDWKLLDKHQNKMKKMYPPNPVGGAFFANKLKYIEAGMENLFFYGWGIEDGERIIRWKKLGYKYERVQGNLYHLTHTRMQNSTHNAKQRSYKLSELNRIRNMTKEELLNETTHSKKNMICNH